MSIYDKFFHIKLKNFSCKMQINITLSPQFLALFVCYMDANARTQLFHGDCNPIFSIENMGYKRSVSYYGAICTVIVSCTRCAIQPTFPPILNEISLLEKYKKKRQFSNLLIDQMGISLMICILVIPFNNH